MSESSSLESTSVTERLVLHEFAELERKDRTPVQTPEVLGACRERLEAMDDVVGGRLTEGDLMSACRTLEDRGLLDEMEPDATSPVGKGRPFYDLAVDADTVRELVREDDRLKGLPPEGTGS